MNANDYKTTDKRSKKSAEENLDTTKSSLLRLNRRQLHPRSKIKRNIVWITILIVLITNGFRLQAQQSAAPCNEYSSWTSDQYSNLSVVSSTSFSIDNWSNKEQLIDADKNDFASWSTLIAGSAWIEARDADAIGAEVFPAGSYAGFVVNDLNLLSLGASMRVTTYLDGVERENVLYSDFLNTVLDGNGRRKIGFVTTQTFNRIRLTVNAGLSVSFTANAYYAEVVKPCAGAVPVCNTPTELVRSDYGMIIEPSRTGLSGVGLGSITDADKVVNSDTGDHATISLNAGVLASASISARSLGDEFPAGFFAGFEVANAALLGLELLDNTTITTYLNGVVRESRSASQLLISAPLLSATGRQVLGFATTQSFNEIRYTISQPLGISLGSTNVYDPVIKKYCVGPELLCNVQTSVTEPAFPVNIAGNLTGITGAACVGCNISGSQNVLDVDASNSATITLTAGIAVSGSLAVTDGFTTYPAGTFAGFEYQNPVLIGTDLLDFVQIRTYLNGVQQEVSTNATLIAGNSSLLSGLGRQIAGFVATQPFNTVRITLNQGVSVDLGTTQIFRAVFQKMCIGPALACNVNTNMVLPQYPMSINNARTGIFGVGGVGCSVNNTNNVINADLNDSAEIVLLAGVGVSGSISVLDALTDYGSGTFVGFDIENTTLLDAEILNGITIMTYLNGNPQESKTGLGSLISVGTSLLTDDGRRLVGFVASLPFDEARISIVNLVDADVGTTRVFKMVTKNLCAVTLECGQTYYLSEPQFPVVINGALTGIQGIASVGSAVQNTPNVISEDQTDFAMITVAVGALNTGSISVQDPISTYPAGSVAGFVIQDVNTLLQVDLFESLMICTRLNGVVQECKMAGDLIDLSVFTNWIGDGPGVYNLGFVSSMPFDEITISVSSLASALNVIRVFSAYVDTRSASGGGLDCLGIITGTVRADIDGDGLGDTPQSALTISLLDENDTFIASTSTASDGSYSFENLAPGSYKIVLTVPNNFTAIDDVDGGDFSIIGDVALVVVVPGATVDEQDFVNQEKTSIAGNVLNDLNRLADNLVNGVGTNAGGIYINLVDTADNIVVASLPVNVDGSYVFTAALGVAINTNYLLILTPAEETVGNVLTASTLPLPWLSVGENLGAGAGNDGAVDGKLSVSTTVGSLTQANFGIVQVPDVTPILTAFPNVMTGPTLFNVIIRVNEINSINSNGLITVRVPKDLRWTRSEPYNPALLSLNAIPLENSKWAYSENLTHHIFLTNDVIPAGGSSNFGFRCTWNAGQTTGIFTMTSQIDSGSGEENRNDNNADAEKIDYFIN